ncbi:MAG: S41 family peptidase [Lawsonibacter sp.]
MKKKLFALLLALSLTFSLVATPAMALELEDAKKLLQDHYVDEIPDNILQASSLEELLQALGDPYTVYMSAEEYLDFLTSVNGDTVVGIGVSLQTTYNNGFQILSILPDSPALEVGLAAGDRIIAVNGETLSANSNIQELIGGEAGTQVTITVIRQADGSQQDYTITRRSVAIPIVTYDTVGDATYIDCSSFGSSTVSTIAEALTTLDADTAVWILDLRSNPGGTTEAAAGSAGLFSGSQIMVYFRDSRGNYNYLYTLPTTKDLTDKPLVILTSPYSASGSELFTAAARDHGFGIALGQRTFGKGIAQTILDEESFPDLFDGDGLKLTTYRFYSPNGTTNHVIGILPTLVLSIENTPTAALLLSNQAPNPGQTADYLRLDLYGFSFYINLKDAKKAENQAAFTELLEALPPNSYTLWEGTGDGWNTHSALTPESVAKKLGLTYVSRCSFTDLTNSPYRDEIATLATYQLLDGYSDGLFRPTASITRGEFCAMVASAFNLTSSGSAPTFSDVSSESWYAGAVSAMASRGFLSGYADGTFRPDAPISYEEVLAILAAISSWCTMKGYDLAQQGLPASDWLNYQTFSEWAQDSAWRLEQMGVSLDREHPQQDASREVCAHLIYSTMDACGLFWNITSAAPIDGGK